MSVVFPQSGKAAGRGSTNMKEFRWEKAAQFHFPFEAAALNFIVTFFREHTQCRKRGVLKGLVFTKLSLQWGLSLILSDSPSLEFSLQPEWSFVFVWVFLLSCGAPVQLTWGCGAEHHVLQFVLLCSFLRERGKRNCWICVLFICRKNSSSKLVLFGQHLCWLNFYIF